MKKILLKTLCRRSCSHPELQPNGLSLKGFLFQKYYLEIDERCCSVTPTQKWSMLFLPRPVKANITSFLINASSQMTSERSSNADACTALASQTYKLDVLFSTDDVCCCVNSCCCWFLGFFSVFFQLVKWGFVWVFPCVVIVSFYAY